jgi:hypothetical protein
MRRTHLVMIVAIVLAMGLLLGARKQAGKGQYAGLFFGYGVSYKWSWKEPGFSVEGDSVYKLCKKLQIQTSQDKADTFEVVNWASSKGWELVTMGSVGQENTSVIWFKKNK